MLTPMMIVVAAALIDGDGRVLVQRRPPGAAMAGLWEFPGGKIETHEDPESALVRELHEELAIVVKRAALSPACFASEPLGTRHLLLLVFICREWSGTPQPLAATELRWTLPGDLHALDMPHADRPLIPLLQSLL